MQTALEAALKGRTSLVIAHRLSTIRAVDRIVVFHKGRIVEVGSHDELLQKNGVYARLHKLQFCLLYTSPSPRDRTRSRMPSSA